MGYTLSLIKVYGYPVTFDEDDEDNEDLGGDDILDRITGMGDSDIATRIAARKALGVEFELYSRDGDDGMPRFLTVTEASRTVYDDGIMPAGTFEVGADWRAKLDHVVKRATPKITAQGEPGWYFLARFF